MENIEEITAVLENLEIWDNETDFYEQERAHPENVEYADEPNGAGAQYASDGGNLQQLGENGKYEVQQT